jgi:LysM repeat protein
MLVDLPSSIQLRVVTDTTGTSDGSISGAGTHSAGTNAAVPLAPAFDLRLVALDTASGLAQALPESVAGASIEVRLPLPSAVLAAGEEVSWLMEVVGPEREFLGYIRPPSVFDPTTQQVVVTIRADQLRGTLFLPIVWRTAYVRNDDPSVHIWSSPFADAVDFGEAAPHWTRMLVLAPAFNQRLLVLNEFSGQPGWVDLAGVGAVQAEDAIPAEPIFATDAPMESPPTEAPLDIAPMDTPSESPVPAVSADQTYTVQPGDTLKGIAAQVDSTIAALVTLNPGINPDSLTIGYQLSLPSAPR